LDRSRARTGAEAQAHRHIAIGVRDNVLPPMPIEARSGTSAAASSSGITFSRRLRSLSLVRRQSSVSATVNNPLPNRPSR
jgi:hypothetical protein